MTDKTPATTLPERDKERDYELEQSMQVSAMLAQNGTMEVTDIDE